MLLKVEPSYSCQTPWGKLQGPDSSERFWASVRVNRTHASQSELQGEWGRWNSGHVKWQLPPRSLLGGASAWAPTSGLNLAAGAGGMSSFFDRQRGTSKYLLSSLALRPQWSLPRATYQAPCPLQGRDGDCSQEAASGKRWQCAQVPRVVVELEL